MDYIEEKNEYTENVFLLKIDTLVRGYDGEEIGPANEQAQALANRTKYLKKAIEDILAKTYVASVNKRTGDITITYEDVETDDDHQFASAKEKQTWNDKQDRLVSGETLKTVLGLSLLGEGNITINSKDIAVDDDLQFVSKADKTAWYGKQDTLVSGENIVTLHNKKLLDKGNITLTADDVGAESAGTADKVMSAHLASEDPHAQYLTQARGDESYVSKSDANKPNGYIKLDANGYMPADISSLYEVRYNIVDNKEERLAIVKSKNLTIALQLDENKVYYLDSDVDPSVDENWKVGRSTEISSVVSVFGRTGSIDAEAGDYNADQITETDTRLFVSPKEKSTWGEKQDKLISGTSIKTVNNTTLLGEGNISITPSSIGAAEEGHKHSADDIETTDSKQFISSEDRTKWDAKQDGLVSGKNIKTINSTSVLGEGDIAITAESIGAADESHTHVPADIKTDEDNQFISSTDRKNWNDKQDKLVSGTNIKTINGVSVIGEGNIKIAATDIETDSDNQFVSEAEKKEYASKQNQLVSGTNLATVFGQSLLTPVDVTLDDVDNLAEVINNLITPGNGIKVSLDTEKNRITISKTSDNSSINLTVKEINNAKANESYYFQGESDNYNILAYSLVERIINDETITINYPEDARNLVLSESPDLTPIVDNYILNLVAYNDYDYGTKYIEKSTKDVDTLDIEVTQGLFTSVPILTSNTSSDGTFKTIGSKWVAAYDCSPWRSLSKEFTASEQKNVPNYTYFCDDQTTTDTKNGWENEIYIGITSTRPVVVTEYRIQRVTKFLTGTTTVPVSWKFQGRDSEDEGWDTIESRTGQAITGGTDWLVYKLDKEAAYKQYRLLVTEVKEKGRRTGMTKLRFYSKSTCLILGKDNNYYLPNLSGGITKIADIATFRFDTDGFANTPVSIQLSALNNIMPIKVISMGEGSAKLTYKKLYPSIAINTPIRDYADWEELDQVKINSSYAYEKENMRYAISIGTNVYYVFKNSTWQKLSDLDTKEDSATILLSQGMTSAAIEGITSEQWGKLFTLDDTNIALGMAYAIKVNGSEKPRTPKEVNFIFNSRSEWVKDNKATISFSGDKIYLIPGISGNCKFFYQFF